MTGGIGTILDNTSREQTNRDNSGRIRYLHDRIRKAYQSKTAHQVPQAEKNTPETMKAKEIAIDGIRKRAVREQIRSRNFLLIFGILAILLAICFFIFVT